MASVLKHAEPFAALHCIQKISINIHGHWKGLNTLITLLPTHKQRILSHLIRKYVSLKKLIPWRDSNPGVFNNVAILIAASSGKRDLSSTPKTFSLTLSDVGIRQNKQIKLWWMCPTRSAAGSQWQKNLGPILPLRNIQRDIRNIQYSLFSKRTRLLVANRLKKGRLTKNGKFWKR
jgi:hypothetical protein